MFKIIIVWINVLLLLALVTSCSSQKPVGKTEAESLYLEAQQLISKKDTYQPLKNSI